MPFYVRPNQYLAFVPNKYYDVAERSIDPARAGSFIGSLVCGLKKSDCLNGCLGSGEMDCFIEKQNVRWRGYIAVTEEHQLPWCQLAQ